MADRTPMEIMIEYGRRKRREKEEADQKEYEKSCYGSWCKHVVTDEDQGMIFCIECGVVTQDQIPSGTGGGSYGMYRRMTEEEKRQWDPRRPKRK